MILPVWLILAICSVSLADVTFYNPMSSSSYARVQYANTNNSVIRRLGAHRDPTIQYVNFDDLYNKHHSKSTYGQRVGPTKPQEETKSSHQGESWEEEERSSTTAKTLSWEEAPDLTNGWTIEKKPPTTPHDFTTPSFTTPYDVTTPHASKTGLDYVYAYSNGYNAYNEHDNFPKRVSGGVKVRPTTTRKSTHVSSYADDTAEYEHYLSGGDVEASTPSTPPVVMEASWTEEQIPSNFLSNKPIKPTQETVRRQDVTVRIKKMPPLTTRTATTTTTTTQRPKPSTASAPTIKRNGVQSDWRPFSATQAPSTEGTLFYSDTQNTVKQQSFSDKQQFPAENIPVFMLNEQKPTQGMEEAGSNRVVFPSPTENEITKTEAVPKPTFPSMQSSASISVSGNGFQNQERPTVSNNNFQRFQPNNQFQRPGPQGHPNERPPMMNNRPQFLHQQPQQHQGQSWPNEPNFRPNEQRPIDPNFRPNEQRPIEPNFRPNEQRPNEPNFRPNEPIRPNQPNFRPDIFNGPQHPQQQPPPQRLPSGPVGLPPQLQPNQGRPEEDHMTIRLPLPKPGTGIGSSPHNPLPGPPIFLNPQQEENSDRIDGPQTPSSHGGQFDNFNHIPGGNPQFRPHPANRFPPPNFPRPQGPPPPHFRPPTFFGPPPSTTTATSIIKSFFSKIFPFGARSLDAGDLGEGTLDEEYNQTTLSQPEATSKDPKGIDLDVTSAPLNATSP